MRLGFGRDLFLKPLDPNDRQNDDGRRLVRTTVTAEAHNAPLVGKFNYVAHQPLSSAAGTEASCLDPETASGRLSAAQG